MTKTEVTGSIKGGVIQLNNFTRKRLQDDLRQFADCDIQIIIKKKGKRSSQANRFYWGCLIDTAIKRMRELGLEYRYLADLLEKKITKEFFLNKLETEIWRFSKRQLTWFNRDKEINWFQPTENKKIVEKVRKFLDR